MAYISYGKLWRSEFYNNVSLKGRLRDKNFNHIKLKVIDSYKKDETITTSFERSNLEDVVNKAYLDRKLFRIEGHISFFKKKIKINLNS